MKCQVIDEPGAATAHENHMQSAMLLWLHNVVGSGTFWLPIKSKNESRPIKTRQDSKSASQSDGAEQTRHSMTVLSLLCFPHAQ